MERQGQKHINNFLNMILQCFRFKVQFIGKFPFKNIRDMQVMKVCKIFLNYCIHYLHAVQKVQKVNLALQILNSYNLLYRYILSIKDFGDFIVLTLN